MNYKVIYSKKAMKIARKWEKSAPDLYKKLWEITKELALTPRAGIGHPEPLVKGNNMIYSRRISGKDRIVYEIHEEEVYVLVISIGGHYDDK